MFIVDFILFSRSFENFCRFIYFRVSETVNDEEFGSTYVANDVRFR